MREISPAIGVSVEDWVQLLPAEAKCIVEEIRRQKREGTRQQPSATLTDRSAIMTKPMRDKLLDAVAMQVDENYAGCAEMCLQFTGLLSRALWHLKFPSRSVVGTAIYYGAKGEEIWRWRHSWVRIGNRGHRRQCGLSGGKPARTESRLGCALLGTDHRSARRPTFA